MAFEHPREAIAHLLARLADNDGARNVGRTVLVLSAGIDQEQLVRADMAVGRARHTVVYNGAVWSGAGDGRKGNILERSSIAAEALQRGHSIDFGEFAGRSLFVEPGEETGHRDTITFVCRAAADDLCVILRRFQQSDRVGTPLRLA